MDVSMLTCGFTVRLCHMHFLAIRLLQMFPLWGIKLLCRKHKHLLEGTRMNED